MEARAAPGGSSRHPKLRDAASGDGTGAAGAAVVMGILEQELCWDSGAGREDIPAHLG